MTISRGRGTHYHGLRAAMEHTLGVLYRGDWPAKLWALYPRGRRVHCVRERFSILPPTAATLRVGFVSDIHIGPTTPPALLDAAFDQLARERLDVLLLGGDYVFLAANAAKAARLAELVARVPATHKLAVLGNHDLWTDHTVLERALDRAGVHLLENRSYTVAPGVTVVGLDDPWTGSIDAARAFEGAVDEHASGALIVLCHSPDGLPAALAQVTKLAALGAGPSGLYVCGHTHGGQMAAPWGPLWVPGIVGKRYPYGLHYVPPLYVHVSRGVGATELPIRSYAPADVSVFELVARR
ncbi:MAG: hypothetical protein RL701_228 [Pseudomonadota bacterium]|jgi:predicted MPP superfamily phosphohydrolase